ncbi:glutamine amidotransferase [Bordetella sp. FB-8]|uniref:glutamine amidotransferase n=1 Tax=Bordetella sp. FB-8 TaxID=1159870 RepID=UPI00037E7D17|nr:glutamine amidotransferase [Bordetella sp. FB-8]
MTASLLPVLILHTGDPQDTLRDHHGGYAEQLCRAAGLRCGQASVVAVYQGEIPLSPAAYRAVLITGSPAMVTDHEPWSEASAVWLREAVAAGLPIFGVCYGHQLLAYALGGDVDYNPAGRSLGTRAVERTGADPLTAGLPDRFSAQMMHSQIVTRPPEGSAVLARADHDPHQLLRYAPGVYSCQFHPEFGTDFMREYLLRNAQVLSGKGLDVPALANALESTPLATGLLKKFLDLYASRATA